MTLDEMKLYQFIKNSIYSARTETDNTDDKYHHNTSYDLTPNIIKYGLLSAKEKAKLFNMVLSDEVKFRLSDECYVNGEDNISLSVVGLTDLRDDEFEYDPFLCCHVDIIISDSVRAYRNCKNYGNEFLARDRIENTNFKAIDVRLLDYVVKTLEDSSMSDNIKRKKIIECFNYLKKIAKALKEANLDIPLREMSSENITLDKEKVSNFIKLTLEK